MISFLKFIARVFIKITGLIPYLIIVKPKFYYCSEKAKKEFRNLKNGAIIVSNHTSIFDFYVILFKKFFKVIHTFVADLVYKIFGLKTLNSIFENIYVSRCSDTNHTGLNKASKYLRKNKVILIFPEGKLESKRGKLESFSDSASYLSISENKKIIPIYIDGNYGLFKRVHIMVGEPINPEISEINVERENLKKQTEIIKDQINELKNKLTNAVKFKNKFLFSSKFWVMDFVKITSIPLFYFVFPTKKYYQCRRKEIKKALKYNCVVAGNHYGPCDPFFMYMHFFSRRIRIIATESLFDVKFMAFAFNHSGVIKYRRDTMKRIDVDAFKESLDILYGNGCLGIFPEGHINFDEHIDESFKQGCATFSLMSNSPIIPFVFVNRYRYFRYNKVIIGKPIYPKDYFDLSKGISSDMIAKYNKIIYERFNDLYKISLERRGRHE